MSRQPIIYISIIACITLMLTITTIMKSAHPETEHQIETSAINHQHLILNNTEGIVYYKAQVFSGSGITYYSPDYKSSEISYLNGKKHGVYKKWFTDGSLSYEAYYKNGKLHGVSKTWWRNGRLRSISNFNSGTPHGAQEEWYKSGAKFKVINLAYGHEVGIQRSWRENGKIYNNYEAKNGRIFGLKRANLCFKLDDEIVQINS